MSLRNRNRVSLNSLKRCLICTCVLIFCIYCFSLSTPDTGDIDHGSLDTSVKEFRLEISKTRLNRLVKVLESKETLSHKRLGLISFKDLKTYFSSNSSLDPSLASFKSDIDKYLELKSNVEVTDTFVNHLVNLSNFYSFKKPREQTPKINVKKVNFGLKSFYS